MKNERVSDIDNYKIAALSNSVNFAAHLYADNEHTRLRIYQVNKNLALSDILPVLENFGLRTLHEERHEIRRDSDTIYITEFTVDFYQESQYPLEAIKETFENTLMQVVTNGGENDAFNRLVLAANFDINTIVIIRAYAKYLKQIKYRYNQNYIENTVVKHVAISRLLVELFTALHHPVDHNKDQVNAIECSISKKLEAVKNIDEDNIIRRLLLVIKSTMRTNYFQLTADNQHKSYITLKIQGQNIPDLPLPKPLIDTFVYSALFEGIHLRSTKVSRGGIRWSDRPDDYRTEVLGLMKAQKVKNAIIIPSGAKGGFIIKEKAYAHYPDKKQSIIACYQQFIRGLLDITDNLCSQTVIRPENVVCHDEVDTYFVVAADKGTADLSDYANKISSEYHFWLGDAFASGGSNGYDHKMLGITAKGAWESLKRNLQEIHRENTSITMVGIGDMSGDVFGNGLIISDKIKLIAAFDHRHIFLDPDPDESASLQERLRLFKLPTSSWADYQTNLISSGGGVFARSEKTISLSPEIKRTLDIQENELTPDQLIRAILKAPVDVLYNGGIGTYVKSSRETSENLGDKYNEFCRVNGCDLRCKIVCEGGNLGFTQLARVEYALKGGLINTDFIDNSAGVDCSDHEVNIKILLSKIYDVDQLNNKERNKLLNSMEQDICKLVLQDNYYQALLMSYSSFHALNYFDLYHEQIRQLENDSDLDRTIEFLPSDEELMNRKNQGKSLTKPELAVLLAYTKIYVKEAVLKSDIPDDAFFNNYLYSAFPYGLIHNFSKAVDAHPLRGEIIATQLSNDMINTMGMSFPFRMHNETGAAISEIAAAYALSSAVFKADKTFQQIYALDNKINVELQYGLLHAVRALLNMSSRWFLHRRQQFQHLQEVVDYYAASVDKLRGIIPSLIRGSTKEFQYRMQQEFTDAGLSTAIADNISISRVLYTALNIADVSSIHDFNLEKTARLYFHIGATFNLVWFRDYLASDNLSGKRNNLARLTLRDDIDAVQRRLMIVIMQSDPSIDDIELLTKNWIADNNETFTRWTNIFNEVSTTQPGDYTAFFIAIRELSVMINSVPKIEKLSLLAYHDGLTKLPNRFAMTDRLQIMLEKAKRDHAYFAVHFIDLNKFKQINDRYGHHIGDLVLIEVTKRLIASIRSGDVVARQSGDEFIIMQADVKDNNDVIFFANTLLTIISKPMYLEQHRLNIKASIGSAIYPMHGKSALELISKADSAMYNNKHKGLHEAALYDGEQTTNN